MKALLLILVATQGQAQMVDMGPVRQCLAQEPRACVGQQARACAEQSGEGIAGMETCIGAETAVWERLMEEEIARLRITWKDHATVPGQIEASQTSWTGYRDAHCALAADSWSDAAQTGVVAANCRMEMAADRAGVLYRMGR